MKMYKCIIIDDEPFVVDWLSGYVKTLPNLCLVNSYLNPLEALSDLAGHEPIDLVLLDVNMPFMSGIDLSREIRPRTRKLVFTTAHKRFAYEAFEANADAFLLKPYTLSKFAATIAKLFPNESSSLIDVNETDFFFAKNKHDNFKLVKIKISDVVAVESKQNYILIHTMRGNVLTHMSLTEMSKILQSYSGFKQFQRSFILAEKHIEYVAGNTIKMANDLQITIGDYYRREFVAFMIEKSLKSRG